MLIPLLIKSSILFLLFNTNSSLSFLLFSTWIFLHKNNSNPLAQFSQWRYFSSKTSLNLLFHKSLDFWIFRLYDNMDIREILKPQSLDEIYEKITEAKDTKAKKLVLTKH